MHFHTYVWCPLVIDMHLHLDTLDECAFAHVRPRLISMRRRIDDEELYHRMRRPVDRLHPETREAIEESRVSSGGRDRGTERTGNCGL
jgi:hypothetical protein